MGESDGWLLGRSALFLFSLVDPYLWIFSSRLRHLIENSNFDMNFESWGFLHTPTPSRVFLLQLVAIAMLVVAAGHAAVPRTLAST